MACFDMRIVVYTYMEYLGKDWSERKIKLDWTPYIYI